MRRGGVLLLAQRATTSGILEALCLADDAILGTGMFTVALDLCLAGRAAWYALVGLDSTFVGQLLQVAANIAISGAT